MDLDRFVRRRCLVSSVVWLLLAPGPELLLHGQGGGFGIPSLPSGPRGPAKMIERYPASPSVPPESSIPLLPLGFSTPGENYLLRHQSLVSLDFLDEQHLLFTFYVASGLMQRDSQSQEGSQQRIRALVLDIRSRKISAQQMWNVPDKLRYLWMLKGGHFLLRSREGLDEGDSELNTRPYLRLPGRLMWIQMDPKQQFIIANSLEPPVSADHSNDAGLSPSNQAGTTITARGQEQLVTRTIQRESLQVMRVTQVPWTSQKNDWPMNSQGYLERVHEDGANWSLRLRDYSGKEGRVLARMESTCLPRYSFVSDSELTVSTCDPEEGWKLTAISSDCKTLWHARLGNNEMSSQMIASSNGSRMIWETLLLRHAAERYKRMIGAKDLLGQMVKVFDSTTGKVLLTAPVKPIFDGGGNVAISPSGKRVAILGRGAIQVFDLPVAPGAQTSTN